MSKAKRPHTPYKRVADRAAEGNIDLVDPLDYLILDSLPPEGTTMGGVIPLGETVRNLANTTFKGIVTNTALGGRMTSLQAYGLVKGVVLPSRDGRGWQITPAGDKALREWQSTRKEQNGNDGS